jgi:hypothetical protein
LDTPGTARLSVLMTFAGWPAPASSSSVASKIELAGKTVRSSNLAVPVMALSGLNGAAFGAFCVLDPVSDDRPFAQPATPNSKNSVKNASKVHDAARHALWVLGFFHVL